MISYNRKNTKILNKEYLSITNILKILISKKSIFLY